LFPDSHCLASFSGFYSFPAKAVGFVGDSALDTFVSFFRRQNFPAEQARYFVLEVQRESSSGIAPRVPKKVFGAGRKAFCKPQAVARLFTNYKNYPFFYAL
jgi:hypothetical protein